MSAFSHKGLLGELEQLVIMALLRLNNEAHAPAVVDEIITRTGISFTRGTIYVALDRLDQKGYLSSYFSEPIAERGGKAKRLFSVTKDGRKALTDAHRAVERMKVVRVKGTND